MNDKFDITKLYPNLYRAEAKEPVMVQVPALRVLAVSGEGNPNADPFQKAVEALYSTAYGIKFMPKRGPVPEGFVDFKVPPLEALWSMRDGKEFDTTKPDQWQWEAFLVVPGFVTQHLAQNSANAMADKHPNHQYDNLRIKTLEEKQAVQIMHIGSYKNETADIALMRSYMESHDLKPSSAHHEIYLSDPRRVATSKLKTILRQPVIKK
jgi:hypothetical protein